MRNGGLITKTINTPIITSASGVWNLQEQYEAETNEAWPKFQSLPEIASGLSSWYDATDISTLYTDTSKTTNVTSHGDTVRLWADKSGGGYDMTTVSTYEPAYDTQSHTQACVDFDGTNWMYNATDKVVKQVYAVTSSTVNASNVLFGFDNADNQYAHFDTGGTVYNSAPNLNGTAGSYESVSGYTGIPTTGVHLLVVDLVNFVRMDYTQYASNNPYSHGGGSTGTYIGRRENSATADLFNGKIIELIGYDRHLNSTEIENVEDYLNIKHNLGLTR